MRQIMIEQKDGGWGFDGDDGTVVASTLLLAAIKAMDHGELLRGHEVGYVIRSWAGRDLVTFHHRVFQP